MTKTNGPKETKEWEFSFRIRSAEVKTSNTRNYSEAIRIKFQEMCKVICFTKDGILDCKSNNIKALNRGYSHPRMWAQYAGNHSGVCMVFSKYKLNKKTHNELGVFGHIYQGSVKYCNRVGNIEAFTLDYESLEELGINTFVNNYFKRHYKTLLFEKLSDWKSEFEYRWILIGATVDYEYFSIEDTISGIIIGAEFPEELLYEIYDYSIRYRIPMMRIVWHNGYPVLYTI
jgi:hypothetical protein